jgi:hypothetical protein
VSSLHSERRVARPADDAFAVFAGPVGDWLPVIVGPDEDSWRVETREAGLRVGLVVEVGGVWVLPDGTHHRRFAARPDATAPRDLVVAGLTPAIEGELWLVADDGECRLGFDGRTRPRSRATGWLERLVVGDPLGRSGIASLLDIAADRLARAPAPGDDQG